MGILSAKEIIKQVELGTIKIDPFNIDQLNPNSYNVRLSDKLKVYDELILDVRKKPREKIIDLSPSNPSGFDYINQGYRLLVGTGYLGSTIEKVGSTKFVPIINGRSTLGRYFLTVHQTAGFGDIGFYGNWTLEIVAMMLPVTIYPGIEIAQICFERVEGEIDNNWLYKGRYQGQDEPQGAKPL